MHTHIAILRGINVSGHKIIKMAELTKHLENAGFDYVKTYIQSGNIVLRSSEKDPKKVSNLVQKVIKDHFTFDVPCLILSREQMIHFLDQNPYLKDESKDPKRIYFAFLYDEPSRENLAVLEALNYPKEELVYYPGIVYGHSEIGFAKAKISNNLIENKLKVTASTRNVNTVKKLITLSTFE